MRQIVMFGRPRRRRRRFRVLICDDEEVFRVGLRTVLTALPQIVVVAETAEPSHALELSAVLTPHLALVSSELGNAALVDALNRQGIRVIVLGAESAHQISPAPGVGATADGYVSRGASSVAFLDCVRAAMPSPSRRRPECPDN